MPEVSRPAVEHAARRSWKSQEQKTLVIGKLIEGSAEYQATIERIRKNANRARAEAAKKQHEVSNPRIGESKPVLVFPQSVGRPENKASEIVSSLENACTTEPEAFPSFPEPKNKGLVKSSLFRSSLNVREHQKTATKMVTPQSEARPSPKKHDHPVW